METIIHPSLCSKIPDFKAGVIFYQDIEIGPSPQMLKGRLQLFQESLYFDLEEKELTDFPGISEWRHVFKAAGTNPSRYRPAHEALYRRVKKQNYLSPVHSAIDLNNFFSLKYEVPIGIYDSSQIEGNVSIKIGDEHDEYAGLNGRINSMQKMITASDEKGCFGSPFVDSERTKVTESTKQAIQIIYLAPSISIEKGQLLTESLMNMFIGIHGGTAACHIIHC